MSEPAIAIRDLVVRRGGHEVVRVPQLEVPARAVTGLMGPSGCGKTTLMRAIVGVERTAGGSVDVLGRPAGSAALRVRVGYMTQAPAVYGDLTVRENLRFFARVPRGLRRPCRRGPRGRCGPRPPRPARPGPLRRRARAGLARDGAPRRARAAGPRRADRRA